MRNPHRSGFTEYTGQMEFDAVQIVVARTSIGVNARLYRSGTRAARSISASRGDRDRILKHVFEEIDIGDLSGINRANGESSRKLHCDIGVSQFWNGTCFTASCQLFAVYVPDPIKELSIRLVEGRQ